MAAKNVFPAAGAFGKQVRGAHPTSGHSHQLDITPGGSGSTTVSGITSNSILLQVQRLFRKGTGSGLLYTGAGATKTDLTSLVTGVGTVAGKIVHTGANWTTSLLLVSWDQPDA